MFKCSCARFVHVTVSSIIESPIHVCVFVCVGVCVGVCVSVCVDNAFNMQLFEHMRVHTLQFYYKITNSLAYFVTKIEQQEVQSHIRDNSNKELKSLAVFR